MFVEAINSLSTTFYNQDQLRAWSSLAFLPGALDRPLLEGRGWLSIEKDQVKAFAVRYPLNRLAMLYCKGCSSRKGHATALLDKIELEARQEKRERLVTEASLISHPLLIRRGWSTKSSERITISGVSFDRYLMDLGSIFCLFFKIVHRFLHPFFEHDF